MVPTRFRAVPRRSDTTEKLLGDKIDLYYYKMMVKEVKVGGQWE